MYRNVYMDSYKTFTQSNTGLESLLIHFNYVYATLGSILADLEYAIGKTMVPGNEKQHPTPRQSTKKDTVTNPNIDAMKLKMDEYGQFK